MLKLSNHRLLCFGFVLFFSLGAERRALAQQEPANAEDFEEKSLPLVLIVTMQACSENALPMTEEKTGAEFKGLGFSVDVVGCEGVAEGEGTVAFFGVLEKIAEERGAVCAIRILRFEEAGVGGADIWVADRVTKKTTYKRWTPMWEEDDETAEIIALKIVEILKVSFIELTFPSFKESHPPPPAPVEKMVEAAKAEIGVSTSPAPPKNLQPSEPPIELKDQRRGKSAGRVGLRLGGSVLGTPGSLGALGAVEVGVRWNVLAMLALEVEGVLTPLGKDSKQGDMSLTFSMAAARVWLIWEPLRLKVFRLGLGPGVGILIAWARGFVTGMEGVSKDSTTVGYAGGSLQGVFVLIRNLWLRLGFTAGSSVPRVSVYSDGRQLETFGMPLLEGFLGLELRIP